MWLCWDNLGKNTPIFTTKASSCGKVLAPFLGMGWVAEPHLSEGGWQRCHFIKWRFTELPGLPLSPPETPAPRGPGGHLTPEPHGRSHFQGQPVLAFMSFHVMPQTSSQVRGPAGPEHTSRPQFSPSTDRARGAADSSETRSREASLIETKIGSFFPCSYFSPLKSGICRKPDLPST